MLPRCYKAFDPVVVMPDGHVWGREEGLPKFWIVKIPGMAVDTARKWIASWMDTADPEKPTPLQRRLYRLDRTKIPANILNTLNTTGTISVPLKTAEVGVYAVSGTAASLLRAATLAADAAVYVLTGQNVTFIYAGGTTYKITADGGVYVVSGAQAGLLKGSRLSTEPGLYVLTKVGGTWAGCSVYVKVNNTWRPAS